MRGGDVDEVGRYGEGGDGVRTRKDDKGELGADFTAIWDEDLECDKDTGADAGIVTDTGMGIGMGAEEMAMSLECWHSNNLSALRSASFSR